MTVTDMPVQPSRRSDHPPPVIANLLGLGFTMPLLLVVCFHVEFPQDEVALLAFVTALAAGLFLPALWLARTLPAKVLVFGGLTGHLVWVGLAAVFVHRALQPHTW